MLSSIFRALFKWLTGDALAAYERLQKAKLEAKTDERKLAVEYAIKQTEARQAVLIAEQGWWVTAWIRPLFAYPLILWWSAVIADSIFHFSWDVAALPSPLDEWAGLMVSAYFVGRSIEKAAKAWSVYGKR